jgi:hypothetical protein
MSAEIGAGEAQSNPVLAGSAEDILAYVLESPLPAGRTQLIENPESSYGQNIRKAWDTGKPYAGGNVRAAFLDPRYIEPPAADPDSYRAEHGGFEGFRRAILTEYAGRAQEGHFWKTFEQLIPDADGTEQLMKLVDVYGFLRFNSKHAVRGGEPGRFTHLAIRRAAGLAEDATDGTADPAKISDIILPPLMRLLDQQQGWTLPRVKVTANNSISQALLTEGQSGTAEEAAALHVRAELHRHGYSSFGETKAAQGRRLPRGDRYLTQATLEKIRENEGARYNGLPGGPEALRTIQQLTLATVHRLASQENPVAERLRDDFQRLRQGRGHSYGPEDTRTLPLAAVVEVANACTRRLNQQEALTGNRALPELDPRDLTELSAAYRRILFAMDSGLLAEATEEGDIANATPLRLRMIYIDALSEQWREANDTRGITLGDYILQLKARGWKNERIAQHLEALEAGHPDPGTARFRTILQSPGVRSKRVVYMRRRQGYGAIT